MPSASPFVAALRDAVALLVPLLAPAGTAAGGDSGVSPADALVAKKLVRDLEQALARAEGRDASEADLISIVCHDLKDPLASIVMGAGFLRKTIAEEDAAGRRVVEAIARSTDRMSLVIGDFHDLAKLETGRVKLDLRAWDLVPVLHAAVRGLEPKAQERGIALSLESPPSLMATFDRARLLQVVQKLLSNAIKFTASGAQGKVTVTAAAREDGSAVITVADTGRGIPADRLTSIFDHAANAKRTPRDGPGLGLAIAQGLVGLQGGRIEVTSKVDEGSTFSFAVPGPAAAPASSARLPST